MKRLFLIGGTMGVGKTTVGQILKKRLPDCVFLDGDWCWEMDPFQVNDETKQMVMENICFLLKNFIRCSAYKNIVFCWVMHEQTIIDEIRGKASAGRLPGVSDFAAVRSGGTGAAASEGRRRWNPQGRCDWPQHRTAPAVSGAAYASGGCDGTDAGGDCSADRTSVRSRGERPRRLQAEAAGTVCGGNRKRKIRKKSMKDRHFYPTFFSMYFVLVFQNVISLSVNLADNIMLGAYSEVSLSGVAAVNQIQFIYQQLLMLPGTEW